MPCLLVTDNLIKYLSRIPKTEEVPLRYGILSVWKQPILVRNEV